MATSLLRRGLLAWVLATPLLAASEPEAGRVFMPAELDRAPVVRTQVAPAYPPNLRTLRVPAAVAVAFVVDEAGAVRDAQVVEPGQPECDAAAVAAVGRWRFEPGMKAGRPVATRLQLSVAFAFDPAAVFDVDQLDRAPLVRYQAKPQYPPDLRRRGIGGEVIVEFVVDERGIPRAVQAVSAPHTALGEAAANAVGQWTFFPGMKDGRAVATRLAVPVVFAPAP